MSAASLLYLPASEVHNSRPLSPCEWKIELTISVCTDRTRLHSVMTIPEYMELWMCLPGAGAGCNAAVREAPGGFRLSGANWAAQPKSFLAKYKTSRRNKLIFTWKNEQLEDAGESIVAIRLAGDFARTNVHLKQIGMGSREGYRWHDVFWRQSLSRLSVLFHKVA